MNTPKLVGHGAMLVLTSKVLQKLGACQLLVKNMTSLSQSSVSGTNRFLSLQIGVLFKQSTIHNNIFKSLFLRNVTCSKTVRPAILLAFIRYIQTSSSAVGNLMIFTSQIFKIRDFSQCSLLHQNITKTIHLGRLPRRVLFKQNSGKLCMWS
jgi:hypothetical protein